MSANNACQKLLVLGVDGMDPSLTRKFVAAGLMPHVEEYIRRGAQRQDLALLGALPTITPPMWTTLATGAYPMTHGIEDFNINMKGELDVNFAGIFSKYCHAELLWNVTAEAGKKTLVWHWPGSAWPPTSDSPNLMVVDGTSPGALGCVYAKRDGEFVACASAQATEAKFYRSAAKSTEHFSGDPKDLAEPPLKSAYGDFLPKQDYFTELWQDFKDGIDDFNGYKIDRYASMRTSILMPQVQY